jgi:GNAT superfamily N-acetyltransferase
VPNVAERVIARRGRTEIVLVIHREDSRERRSRAYLITWWFRKHLPYGSKLHDVYDTSAEIDYHVFLARQDCMAVGALLVARPQFGSSLLRWNRSGGHARSARQRRKKPIWKVAFVGVLETRRRKGIAHMLIDEAAGYFRLEIPYFGWTLPFEADGAALVRKLCPRFFWSA